MTDDFDDLETFGEAASIPFCLPEGMSAEVFLNEYWQKKPLLIKNGLPSLMGMFEPEDVLGLAVEEGVLARLITQKDEDDSQWTLKKSPLSEQDLQKTPKLWTVLVQNLEQWSPELGALWQAFDFIPKWQQDDIMVSYAPKGGSVGKHYDEYDVFLAQGYGERRWQLGKMCDPDPISGTSFIEGQPIRLLDDMGEIVFDKILSAGDVLYVPPRLSHYGVAENDCLTFSFGFRRPNMVQVLDEIADVATSEPVLFSPMILPQSVQDNPNLLTNESIQAIKKHLMSVLDSKLGDKIIKNAVAELVSKRQYELIVFEDEIDVQDLTERLTDGECLMLNPASRFVQCDEMWYINGESICFDKNSQDLLEKLMGFEVLNVDDIDAKDIAILTQWLNDNWLVFI